MGGIMTALSRPVALVCLTVQVQGATVRGTALSRPVALVRLTVRVQGATVRGTALSRPVALVRLTVQDQLFELQLRRCTGFEVQVGSVLVPMSMLIVILTA